MTSPTIPMLIGMTQGTEGSVVQNPPVSVGDRGSTPGLGRFPWRRKRQPNPVDWEISWRQKSQAGYSPWGHKRVGHDLAT